MGRARESFRVWQAQELVPESDPNDARRELRLLAAILGRAICDIVSISEVKRHIRRSARNWLLRSKPIDIKKPFSFLWVCEELDLCPKQIRKAVLDAAIWQNQDSTVSGKLSERLERFIDTIYYDPDTVHITPHVIKKS